MVRKDRNDVSLETLMQVLNECQKLTPAQEEKYKYMYHMASEVRLGRIVELGTHLGLGTISLCFGARSNNGLGIYVDTIDWFQTCTGIDGEEYHKADESKFRKNLTIANTISISHISTFSHVANEWAYPIGLLFWDGNVFIPDEDIAEWERFVIPGGRIALYESGESGLGSYNLAKHYVDSGWYEWCDSRNKFFNIRRKGYGVDK